MTGAGDGGKRTAMVIAIVGLLVELATVLLLRGDRISDAAAKPLIVIGMLMAFVPLFVVARRARRR